MSFDLAAPPAESGHPEKAGKQVRYQVRDIPALLRTPVGRKQIGSKVYCHWGWRVLRHLASVYRLTLARRTRVVAVAGSFGKTTTARAISAALDIEAHPDIELNEFSYVAGAVLQIRPYDRHAVIEVGIGRRGQMAGYAQLVRPEIAVVTSIGSEHHRSLETLEVTRAEKSKMVRALPLSGLAVLNGDDPNVRWMASQTHARVQTFGFGTENNVRASGFAMDWPHGTRFNLHVADQTRHVHTRLFGRHYVYPVLAATAVALAEGFVLDEALARLEALPPTPGRLELIRLENGAMLLRDDFKSQLETIDAALDVLAEIPATRRIVVLGDVSEPPGSQGPSTEG